MMIKILSTSRDMVGDTAIIRAEIHEPRAGYTRVKDTIEVEITGGSNVIAIAFTGQAQMPQAVSAANTITTCRSSAGKLEARGTGIGYRAPPALRRSEPPRLGFSGRLMTGNSGRVLRR